MPNQKVTWDILHVNKECAHVLRVDNGNSIYLLGTNHVSGYSVRNVRHLLEQVDPDVVVIELCRRRLERANIYGGDRNYAKRYQELQRIPRHWRKRAAAEMLRLRLTSQAMEYYEKAAPATIKAATVTAKHQQHVFSTYAPNRRGYRVRPIRVRELFIGADVFTPFRNETWYLESNSSNILYSPEVRYKIVLADLPIERTFAKLMLILSDDDKQTIRRYEKNFVELFLKNKTGIMGKIWRENPKIANAMISERNRYLAHEMLKAMQAVAGTHTNQKPVQVVGLVGRRHVEGIIEIWKSDLLHKWLSANRVVP